jgi:hypothetical protein
MHEARTAMNTNDSIIRRHSDIRTNQSLQKSTTRYLFSIILIEKKKKLSFHRNRINSDYTTYSEQSHNSSKSPFSFEELNRALLSFDTSDVFQQQQQQIYPSILPTITNTRRTFSLSSSSNCSLTPQYI